MPEMANLIEVERRGNGTILRIDGREFPWYMAPDVDVRVSPEDAPTVTLTILADEVRVLDRLNPQPLPEVDWLLKHAETEEEVSRLQHKGSVIVGDIYTASDGKYWEVKDKDVESYVLYVLPYRA